MPPTTTDQIIEAYLDLIPALRTLQFAERGDSPWRELDLSMAQLKALMMVISARGLTSSGLAARMRLGASAITHLVDRLAERKLVRREPDPHDRRVAWIRATPKAIALHQRLVEANRVVLLDVLRDLPADDQEQIRRGLRLLASAALRRVASLDDQPHAQTLPPT